MYFGLHTATMTSHYTQSDISRSSSSPESSFPMSCFLVSSVNKHQNTQQLSITKPHLGD